MDVMLYVPSLLIRGIVLKKKFVRFASAGSKQKHSVEID